MLICILCLFGGLVVVLVVLSVGWLVCMMIMLLFRFGGLLWLRLNRFLFMVKWLFSLSSFGVRFSLVCLLVDRWWLMWCSSMKWLVVSFSWVVVCLFSLVWFLVLMWFLLVCVVRCFSWVVLLLRFRVNLLLFMFMFSSGLCMESCLFFVWLSSFGLLSVLLICMLVESVLFSC